MIKIDSLKIEIEQSKHSITERLEKITSVIKRLEQGIINPDKSIFWEFIYPILLSIIAAIIFWVAFSYYPEHYRNRKIRVKIDLEIYQVYSNIFILFDIIFKKNNFSPSDYQNLIRGEKLTRRDIEIGLQNKCLNKTYLYYPELQHTLLPIGKSLLNYIQ